MDNMNLLIQILRMMHNYNKNKSYLQQIINSKIIIQLRIFKKMNNHFNHFKLKIKFKIKIQNKKREVFVKLNQKK